MLTQGGYVLNGKIIPDRSACLIKVIAGMPEKIRKTLSYPISSATSSLTQ